MKKLTEYPGLECIRGSREISSDCDFSKTVGVFRMVPTTIAEAADAVMQAAKEQRDKDKIYTANCDGIVDHLECPGCAFYQTCKALVTYVEATRER